MSISKVLTKISESGFSDPFVAKNLGLSVHSVFNYRNGKRLPDYEVGQKIVELGKLVDKFVADVADIGKR